MTKTKALLKLVAFDAVRYLTNDETIDEYMTAMLETGDTDVLSMALADIAHAKKIVQGARNSGRE